MQAVTSTAFGALGQTGGDGSYDLLVGPGDYTVQFFDCREQPSLAGATLAPIHVDLGEIAADKDVTLNPGATATLSGSVRNSAGGTVAGVCVAVYIANQFVVFGQVVAGSGTFTVTGIPSGTYAVGFIGCENGGSPTIPNPADPDNPYRAQWWQGVPLSLAGTGDGGPDPIAQGATLVAIPPGAALTGFDVCLDCTPPPAPTTTTTTAPPDTTVPASPPAVGITITDVRRAPGTITVSFTADQVAAALRLQAIPAGTTFTATCVTAGGPDASASGTGTTLVVSGVADRASYSCTVVATIDGVVVGRSTSEVVDPLAGGTLPATGGAPVPFTTLAGLLVGAGGLVLLVRRRLDR